ncbi:unnamed protein product [Schistosoma curassoni]|uniref:Myosin motor domain-containing protein n=1 Tax=Schistosoma curassoni TaxID=6186 RepID=A0A183K028_9TREM|nr:unnamed protein product [Schistosoma curassoni]
MTFLPPLRRSGHVVILFKFTAEIACQTAAPARPNIWKADMKAVNLIKEGSESEMIEKDQEKAEAIADYVGAVFTQEPRLDKEPDQNKGSTNHLLIVDFDQGDVIKALSTLNMEKLTGPDELHPQNLEIFCTIYRGPTDCDIQYVT